MKQTYLALAILGAVIPYLYFINFFGQQGLNLPAFVSALFVNGAAAGFTVDLLIASVVFWLYMFQQRRADKGPNPALFIALNLTIGLSCALPAYLYARHN